MFMYIIITEALILAYALNGDKYWETDRSHQSEFKKSHPKSVAWLHFCWLNNYTCWRNLYTDSSQHSETPALKMYMVWYFVAVAVIPKWFHFLITSLTADKEISRMEEISLEFSEPFRATH